MGSLSLFLFCVIVFDCQTRVRDSTAYIKERIDSHAEGLNDREEQQRLVRVAIRTEQPWKSEEGVVHVTNDLNVDMIEDDYWNDLDDSKNVRSAGPSPMAAGLAHGASSGLTEQQIVCRERETKDDYMGVLA